MQSVCVCVESDHPLCCEGGESCVEKQTSYLLYPNACRILAFINLITVLFLSLWTANGFMCFLFFLFFYFCRYHKSQAIYLESKENTKISCVISSVGANEVVGSFFFMGVGKAVGQHRQVDGCLVRTKRKSVLLLEKM